MHASSTVDDTDNYQHNLYQRTKHAHNPVEVHAVLAYSLSTSLSIPFIRTPSPSIEQRMHPPPRAFSLPLPPALVYLFLNSKQIRDDEYLVGLELENLPPQGRPNDDSPVDGDGGDGGDGDAAAE